MGNTTAGTLKALETKGAVSVFPLQRAVQRRVLEGYSTANICRDLGWIDNIGRPMTSRLQRAIGLMAEISGGERGTGKRYYRRHISYELAVRIAKAALIDPVDVGL